MWLIRGFFGLIFIGLAILTVPMWFESPFMVAFTMLFTVIGLSIMGGVTTMTYLQAREDSLLREIEIRKSKWFDFRNRLMGLCVLLFSLGALYVAYTENWGIDFQAAAGVFICMGLWYLVKGAKAVRDITPPRTDDSVLSSARGNSKSYDLDSLHTELFENNPEYRKIYKETERKVRAKAARMEREGVRKLRVKSPSSKTPDNFN